MPPAGATPPEALPLPQILHTLQTEWRKYERNRNEWEIERAELRARIALLEGERRAGEGEKRDLSRRVRMLEWALREERRKFEEAKGGIVKKESGGGTDSSIGSGSGRSSPGHVLKTEGSPEADSGEFPRSPMRRVRHR